MKRKMKNKHTYTTRIKKGLRPLPTDQRDFIHHQAFGSMNVAELPFYYEVSQNIWIKDQKDSDMCATCAGIGASEDQEQVELCFEYQFAKAKELMGDWKSWGTNLRIVCKSLVKFGSLPQKYAPFTLESMGRDYCADWHNWDNKYDLYAKPFIKKSYFKINEHTGKDLYDSLRIALWQNRNYRRSIVSGALWRASWTSSELIPIEYENDGIPHAFKIMGWTSQGLICQLSNGENIGDSGLFYMPRKVANKELNYGNFMFIDIDPDVAKEMHKYNRIIAYLIAYIKKLIKKYDSTRNKK